ncbi:abc transporter [Lucifera butyrica]|uniref:Abc transporter n=1 Tax=Lucifera butyrica TaxID=1351585 RepID=A0A498RE60_9FIRM|nr:ABC transporter ATP-binding protein [Lucifera butyrica]VBB09619.1 abc transporter [Lucifera butyrica]
MNELILEMRGVRVDRETRKNILNIERFSLARGELAAVVGPNGAGKSTLLQTVNLLHPYQGEIRLFGDDVLQQDKVGLRRRCSMVFQETLLLKETVLANVAYPLKFRGLAPDEAARLAEKTLTDFHCSHLAARQARSLSGGEAQRVCIARALVTEPELLLLDEPFAALDAATRLKMIEEIRQVAEAREIAVLLVSHNFADVLHFAGRAIVMFNGSIVQDDKPEAVMRRPVNEQTARLAGVDNIIPCCVEQEGQDRFIKLANGIRFLYHGEVSGPVSACCLPSDALYLREERTLRQEEPWVEIVGLVERVVPGLGTYQILVEFGGQMLYARVPRHYAAGKINVADTIKLVFNPVEAHIV